MNIKLSYIIIAVSLVVTSCSNFLDKFPLDKISSDKYYTSEDQVKTALTSCYSRLLFGDYDANNDHAKECLLNNVIFDCFADNGFIGWGFLGITSGNLNAANDAVSGRYQYSYEAIAIANDFIHNVESKATFLSEASRNQYIAEAKFIRAYEYFGLINTFGDVVLSLEPATADFVAARSPKQDVINAILSDLDYGIANLPNEAYTDGRIKQGAAYALKMKVLLYQQDYAGVIKIWNDYFATSNNKFSIASNYDDIFKGTAQKSCPEIILSAIYVQDSRYKNDIDVTLTAYADVLALPNFMNEFEFNDGSAFTTSSPRYDPVDPFNNRDPRLTKILFDSVQIQQPSNFYYGKLAYGNTKGKLLVKKFAKDEDLPASSGDTKPDQDAVLLRFGDVALMYAEAENELNGPSSKVINAVQLVRGRPDVNMPALSSGLSKDDMRLKIRHERRIELAFEGTRYFDLLRWKLMGSIIPNIVDPNGKQRVWNDYNYLWPLPTNALNRNPKLVQNPGYQKL